MSKVLPPELEGKTPEEIAAHYQGIITQQKIVYEQALEAVGAGNAPQPPAPGQQPPAPPKKTMAEFLANPDDATRAIIKEHGVSREEFNAASTNVQNMMIRWAETEAKKELDAEAEAQGSRIDWARIGPMMKEVTDKCSPQSLTQINTWKTAFKFNIGSIAYTLINEAVSKAKLPAESVTPGGNAPDPKKPLTAAEEVVAEGLGLTTESYNTGRDNMVNQRFPLTMDNRNRR